MADNKNNDESMTTAEAGHMGGERVRELIDKGKEAEGQSDDQQGFRENLKDSSQKRADRNQSENESERSGRKETD